MGTMYRALPELPQAGLDDMNEDVGRRANDHKTTPR